MTTCARARGCAGSRYPFLTRKERDVETGLDFFGARYFASTQGRFTGVDPYEINYERQEINGKDKDPEKAEQHFTEYIGQPQHWNHYAYALNNPLRYVDPDGLLEYETKLFGKKITVEISDKIDKKTQEAIKKEIDNSIAKLNAGHDKITNAQMKVIKLLNGIYVGPNNSTHLGMEMGSGIMNFRQRDIGPTGYSGDFLTGAIIHDTFHLYQQNQGIDLDRNAEKKASAFAVDVGTRIGLDSQVIDWLKKDVITGHTDKGTGPDRPRNPRRKRP